MEKKDVSVKTELEQETHRVLLPTLPSLPEVTYTACLHGELDAEPYVLPFFFLKALGIPVSRSTFLFFECLLCASTLLVFIPLAST